MMAAIAIMVGKHRVHPRHAFPTCVPDAQLQRQVKVYNNTTFRSDVAAPVTDADFRSYAQWTLDIGLRSCIHGHGTGD